VPTSADELRAAIADKTALIVGMVGEHGEPYATRGWALRFPDPDRPRCRLVIGADELPALGRRPGRKLLALTITHIRTLASVQLKGPAGDPEPATADDLDAVRSYCDHFFKEIEETDGTPPALTARVVPFEFVTCELDVEELFDQTPGPRAGAQLRAAG
jgi:hypothetical protein